MTLIIADNADVLFNRDGYAAMVTQSTPSAILGTVVTVAILYPKAGPVATVTLPINNLTD